MGDKSPKSTERKKKQHAEEEKQKKADAFAKQHPAPAVPGNKGKSSFAADRGHAAAQHPGPPPAVRLRVFRAWGGVLQV
jgi:hypothetical protein